MNNPLLIFLPRLVGLSKQIKQNYQSNQKWIIHRKLKVPTSTILRHPQVPGTVRLTGTVQLYSAVYFLHWTLLQSGHFFSKQPQQNEPSYERSVAERVHMVCILLE